MKERYKQTFRLEGYTLTEQSGKLLLWHPKLAGAAPIEAHHLVNLFKRIAREQLDKPLDKPQ